MSWIIPVQLLMAGSIVSTSLLGMRWPAAIAAVAWCCVNSATFFILRSKFKGKREELARRERALKGFFTSVVSNISHEFRTPLTSIIGYAQCIAQGLDGDVTEEQRRDAERIIKSARDLLRMIEDALELSKIESGELDLNLEPLDFKELVSEAVETIEPMAKEKGLDLKVEVPERLPRVLGDRLKLKRVMLNLLSNAVKFTPEGEVRIAVRANDPFLEVSISDTGIGIPREKRDRIFEKGWRADGQGTGLGLAITKELVELHGGQIWFESEPGAGTTFTFTVPIITPKLREYVLREIESRADEPVKEIILKIHEWLKGEFKDDGRKGKGADNR